MKPQFTPYEGDEPYIFVSYSHKDSATVFPIMDKLNAAGFRIWYDEGIEWGRDWPTNLKEHIDNCQVILIFMSQTSLDSPHCQKEIVRAHEVNKIFFPIHLQALTFNDDMTEMAEMFQFIQAVKYYEYADKADKFFDRLIDSSVLQICRSEPSVEWLLEHAQKNINLKNHARAYEYLLRASNKGNVLAAAMLKSLLGNSRGFKPFEDNERKFFDAFIRTPQGGYSQNASTSPPLSNTPPIFEEFIKPHDNKKK